MSTNVTQQDVTIISVIFASIACVMTLTRLVERARTKRLWWDDLAAVISMLFLISLIVATEMHYTRAAAEYGPTVGVASYYTQALSFYVVVWMARLSILLTILHITPNPLSKRVLTWVAGGFVLILFVFFGQQMWICEGNTAWKTAASPPQCPLGLQSAVLQLTTDCVSDLIIILVPLRLLWKAHLSLNLRVRLIAVFATSVCTTVVSIVHAAYLVKGIKIAVIFAAIIEAGVSLMVCNLPILVPALLRVLSWRGGDLDVSDNSQYPSKPMTQVQVKTEVQTWPPFPRQVKAGSFELHVLSQDDLESKGDIKDPSLSSLPL